MFNRSAVCLSVFALSLTLAAPAVAADSGIIDILEGDRVYPGRTANVDMIVTVAEQSDCVMTIASRKATARVGAGETSLRFMVKTNKRARPGKYPVVVRCGIDEDKTTVTIKKRGRAGKSNPVKSIKSRQKLFDNGSDEPVVTPKPVYVADFPAPIGDGGDGWVFIHYAEVNGTETAASLYSFTEFARGAAETPLAGVTAVPIICSTPGVAEKALSKAGIAYPVYVWTAPDCKAQLNARFAGLTNSDSGGLRLIRRSDGRPKASYWMINYAREDGSLPLASWVYTNTQTRVSLANVFSESEGALRGYETGDTVVQHFWDGCPTCRKDESEYKLQAWADQNPGKQIVAVTCADPAAAGQWAYEHGWRFPVIAYGPTSSYGGGFSGECWQRMKAKFGFAWYGDKAFLRNGAISKDAYNTFKGIPTW